MAIIGDRALDDLFQAYACLEAQLCQPRVIEAFSRHAIRFAVIPANLSGIFRPPSDERCQIAYGNVSPRADVYDFCAVVAFHQKDQCFSYVLNMDEFTLGRAGAPEGHKWFAFILSI